MLFHCMITNSREAAVRGKYCLRNVTIRRKADRAKWVIRGGWETKITPSLSILNNIGCLEIEKIIS